MFLMTVLVAGFFGPAAAAGSWGYGKTSGGVYGPEDWGHVSKYCDGSAQSPVNIIRDEADDDDDDDDDDYDLRVQFTNEDGLVKGTLINNGHSPTYGLEKGGASLVNPYNGAKYVLAQFHFHFGCTDDVGSEHTIDGRSYPGELHLVFYNAKYGNISTAATKSDGLTVIGAFLSKGSSGTRELKTFSRNLNAIVKQGSQKSGVAIRLDYLVSGLSSGDRSFYTYKGSLTTPGCYESVRWIVLKNPITADQLILNNFRALQATHGYRHGKMCNNYRPTQPLNGRRVTIHE